MNEKLKRSYAHLVSIARREKTIYRLALSLIPDWKKEIEIQGIGKFKIRLKRNRSFWLRDPLAHEHFPLSALQQLIKPGDTVYDIGANIGLYTRLLVQRFAAGQVIAFEPMTENYRMLQENIRLGCIESRVITLPYALADFSGKSLLQVDDVMSASAVLDAVTMGKASEGRRHLNLSPQVEEVSVQSIDNLIQTDLRNHEPDVLKIDVEGAEVLVLQGARNFLQTAQPRLLIELHGATYARQILSLLFELGYTVAGKVSPRLHKSGYMFLEEKHITQIQEYYDLHFVIAARQRQQIPLAVRDYFPG